VDRSVADVRDKFGVQTDDAFGSLLEMFDGDKDGVLTFDELSELKELLGSAFSVPSRATPLPDLIRTQGLTGLAAGESNSRAGRSPVSHDQFTSRFGSLLSDVEATFNALDMDKDGSLSPKEFVRLHEHVPPTMDYSSFAKWYHMRLERTDDGGAAIYKALDLDGDALLSAAEIGRMNDALLRADATANAPNPLKMKNGAAASVAASKAAPDDRTKLGLAGTADSSRLRGAGVTAKEWAAIMGAGSAQTPIDRSAAPHDADDSKTLEQKGWLDLNGATVRNDLPGLFPLLDVDGDGSLTGTEQAAFELLVKESGIGPMDPYANPLSAAAARRGDLPLLHQLVREPVHLPDTSGPSRTEAGLDSVLFARLFRVLLGADLVPLLSGEAQQVVLAAQPRGFTRGAMPEQVQDDGIPASATDAGVYATPEVDRRVAASAAGAVDLAQIFSSLDKDNNGVLEGAGELGPLSTSGPPYNLMPTEWSEGAFCFWFVEAFPSSKVGPRVFRNWDVDSDGMLTEQEAAGLLPTLLHAQPSPPGTESNWGQGQKIPMDILLNEQSMGFDRTVFARRFSERLPGVMDVDPIFVALDTDVNEVVTPSELRQVQWQQHSSTALLTRSYEILLRSPPHNGSCITLDLN
jgi:hypothetical protein